MASPFPPWPEGRAAGEEDQISARLMALFAKNLSTLRRDALARLFDAPGRDLNRDCGYPSEPQGPRYYWNLFRESGVARRVVSVFPLESWALKPQVYQTEDDRNTRWERAWKAVLNDRSVNPWTALQRADILSGVGYYGVQLLGFDDGKALDQPVDGIDGRGNPTDKRPTDRKLLYLRSFSQDLVTIAAKERDPRNPRFDRPTVYRLRMPSGTDTKARGLVEEVGDDGPGDDGAELLVHWSRVQHLADGVLSSPTHGTPRCEPVLPHILDVRKVGGGSAEMFWRGAFPGYSVESHPELGADVDIDLKGIREQMDLLTSGFQRYAGIVGASVKSLAPQPADPTRHLMAYLQLIAMTLGIPLQVFLGSPVGQLAGTALDDQWKGRLKNRQEDYISPDVIHPFVHRLMCVGVLPWVDEYVIHWPDLNITSTKDQADIAVKLAQAFLQYVSSGTEMVLPLKLFLTLVVKMTDREAEAVVKAVDEMKGSKDQYTRELWDEVARAEAKAAGTRGQAPGPASDPAARTGSSGRRNSLTGEAA